MKKVVVIFLVSVVLLSILVAAAGSSTSSSGSSSSGSSSTTKAAPAPKPGPYNYSINCDAQETLNKRIFCRLNRTVEADSLESGLPEVCRLVSARDDCIFLYETAEPCYGLTGTEKDACFREASGPSNNLLAFPDIGVRNYLVVLLYDLQEITELGFEEGDIPINKTSDIIEQIVNTKVMILKGDPRPDIQAEISKLKSIWPYKIE